MMKLLIETIVRQIGLEILWHTEKKNGQMRSALP